MNYRRIVFLTSLIIGCASGSVTPTPAPVPTPDGGIPDAAPDVADAGSVPPADASDSGVVDAAPDVVLPTCPYVPTYTGSCSWQMHWGCTDYFEPDAQALCQPIGVLGLAWLGLNPCDTTGTSGACGYYDSNGCLTRVLWTFPLDGLSDAAVDGAYQDCVEGGGQWLGQPSPP